MEIRICGKMVWKRIWLMTLNLIKSLGRFQYSALCKSEMLKPHIRLTANTWSYTQPNHNSWLITIAIWNITWQDVTFVDTKILEKLECFRVWSIKYLVIFVISNKHNHCKVYFWSLFQPMRTAYFCILTLESGRGTFQGVNWRIKTPTSLDSDSFKIWVTGDHPSYTKQVYPS